MLSAHRRRYSIALAWAVIVGLAVPLAASVPAQAVTAAPAVAAPAVDAVASSVRINEFSSNKPDFIELINTGAESVDLTGWVLKDESDNNAFTFPAGSSIAAGAILEVKGEGVQFAFGLGNGDSVRLFTPTTELADSYTYPGHPPAGASYGRCANGTGDFVITTTTTATPGAANDCPIPAIRINEFSSNNPDFIELINTGIGAADLTGWVLKDNSENNSYTFPAGSSIAAGAVLEVKGEGVQFVFGLGNGDSVRLYAPGASSATDTPVDAYTYPGHPAAGKSYGRCPAGTGDFVITNSATPGAANDCPAVAAPPVKINELSSNSPDFAELINTGTSTVDLAGWVLKDSTEGNPYTFPAGSSIAAGAILEVKGEGVQFAFGLGNGDALRLYSPTGILADSHTYPAHPAAGKSWGRCPDGTGEFILTTIATPGLANSCEAVDPSVVKINEVESNGDKVADWVELKNTGSAPVDVSGWKILDSDPDHVTRPVVIPANTVIAAGGYFALYTEIAQSPGFGLGVGDSVTLYLADGTTQIDTTTWGAHSATTWGRCPDGTGEFGETTTATRGLPNACSPVRINEVESEGGEPGDWIELVNVGESAVDVSGWIVKDSDDLSSYAIPTGSTIAAAGHLVVEGFSFGLGGTDSARLFEADGTTLVDSYSWTAHATQSYGRCKDGIGDFVDTKAPTKGAANSCPGLDTEAWPGGQNVITADLAETFLQDLSGLAFDPQSTDTLWASQNKKGTLFKLTRNSENLWVPDAATGWGAGKDPKYTDGTGAPDTEGITIGPDGFVYLASERNNDASGVSRMSILRYDPAATGTTVTATHEWNLTSKIPAAGANLGLEGVTWVPDSFLTENGFVDQSTQAAYNPATYPAHGSGLYFVAVEDTGDLHAFALDTAGTTSHLIATIDGGFEHLADVSYDADKGALWTVTDDTHDGRTAVLTINDAGAFAIDAAYERPAGMPNLNNEGFAIAPDSTCVDGSKEVLWSDDGDTDGHSIRRGTLDCVTPVAELTAGIPVISGSARVGATLTAAAGDWQPAPVALSYQWLADGEEIAGATSPSLTLTAAQKGAVVTVSVEGAKEGYSSVTVESEGTPSVAAGLLSAASPTVSGTPKVGKVLTATAGKWGPGPVSLSYRWYAGGKPISGAVKSSFTIAPAQAGKAITVKVTGTKSGYTTLVKTAKSTSRVALGTLTRSTPAIKGSAEVGEKLRAVVKSWKPSGVSYTYRWYANGKAISGATKSTVTLKKAQAGARITVKVTGSKAGYATTSISSSKTAKVRR